MDLHWPFILKILINVHVRFIIFKRLKWLQMILNDLKLPFLSGIFFFKVGNCICTFIWDFRVLIEIMGNLYFIWLIYFFSKKAFFLSKMPKGQRNFKGFFPVKWAMCYVSLNFLKFLECSISLVSRKWQTNRRTAAAAHSGIVRRHFFKKSFLTISCINFK